MRLLLAVGALALLATFAPPSLQRPQVLPAETILYFQPVLLDATRPGRRRLGRLDYRGGWAVRSNDPRFGGVSAMHVENGRVLALSDAGSLIRFALPATGPQPARIAPLADGPGSGNRKQDRDAESMIVHGGSAWIGFEGHNSVWRYRREGWRAAAAAAPPSMRRWAANRGSEGLVRLRDGRFLIFSEGARGGRYSQVLLFGGDPALGGTGATALRYQPPENSRPTDAALLPDGRLLVLNRRFSIVEGMSATLLLVELPELKEAAMLSGEVIADFVSPAIVDNLEALSVTREGGETILWIASDDNFSPLQRTLLLKFALAD